MTFKVFALYTMVFILTGCTGGYFWRCIIPVLRQQLPVPGEVWVKQSDDPFIKPSEVWYVVSTGYGRETGYHYVQCTNAAGVSKSDISSVFTCRYTRQTKEAK